MLKNVNVPFSEEGKYFFDHNLTWYPQMDSIKKIATLAFVNCRRLCGKNEIKLEADSMVIDEGHQAHDKI